MKVYLHTESQILDLKQCPETGRGILVIDAHDIIDGNSYPTEVKCDYEITERELLANLGSREEWSDYYSLSVYSDSAGNLSCIDFDDRFKRGSGAVPKMIVGGKPGVMIKDLVRHMKRKTHAAMIGVENEKPDIVMGCKVDFEALKLLDFRRLSKEVLRENGLSEMTESSFKTLYPRFRKVYKATVDEVWAAFQRSLLVEEKERLLPPKPEPKPDSMWSEFRRFLGFGRV